MLAAAIAIIHETTCEVTDMALINRMARLFTADFNAVLDRIEEPEVLLRQAVREMEEELARAGEHITSLEREREALIARKTEVETSLSELGEKVDVCFASGNDDLARKLIRRRLEAERLARHLLSRREAAEKALEAARAGLAEGRERLEGIRQKAELLTASAQAAAAAHEHDPWGDVRGDGRRGAELGVGDDEVEVAFLREKQRRARS